MALQDTTDDISTPSLVLANQTTATIAMQSTTAEPQLPPVHQDTTDDISTPSLVLANQTTATIAMQSTTAEPQLPPVHPSLGKRKVRPYSLEITYSKEKHSGALPSKMSADWTWTLEEFRKAWNPPLSEDERLWYGKDLISDSASSYYKNYIHKAPKLNSVAKRKKPITIHRQKGLDFEESS